MLSSTSADSTDALASRATAQPGADLNRRANRGTERSSLQGGLARWQAKRITSYIEDKLDSSIRVTALAGVVQLSTSHFYRAFRKTFGEAPVAYVRKRRIQRAQELMLTSPLPLSQVAVECGMCDQPHLCRVFRRIVGINPNAWRRQFPVVPISDTSVAGRVATSATASVQEWKAARS
jgi:AraC family transcriptional regulator